MRRRRKIAIWLIIASGALAVLHTLALHLSWYWTYRWLDILMHLLGGAVIALFSFFIYHGISSRRGTPADSTTMLVVLIGTVIVIGGAWEILEDALALTRDSGLTSDTIKDIFVDLAGALLVLAYLIHTRALVLLSS